MSLSEEYRRQYAWRAWPMVLAALPRLQGSTVLDLGCGPGDLASDLVARGARVLGFDSNDELLAAARERQLPGAEFRHADLRSLPDPGLLADGIWCSFAAAFFVDLPEVLRVWSRLLRPGGWIALVEVDDLFAHEPLDDVSRALLASYVEDALTAKRYDFRMGRRLTDGLAASGFLVTSSFSVPDRELAFDGVADPEVIEAWRLRLDRMRLLRAHCGEAFEHVRAAFLACLTRPDHRCKATVQCALARLPA